MNWDWTYAVLVGFAWLAGFEMGRLSRKKESHPVSCVTCGATRIKHGVWEYPRHRTAIVQRICPTCFERGISRVREEIQKP